MAETQLLLPNHQALDLYRYPRHPQEPLRAWDAADEYLLHQLSEQLALKTPSTILIVNDSFGALSLGVRCLCPEAQIVCLTDSYTAQSGLKENAEANDLSLQNIETAHSFSLANHSNAFDLAMIKIPKSLAQLEFQLSQFSEKLSPDSQILGGAMAKNIHTSTLDLFTKLLGKTRTSLAKKKARLIFCEPDRPSVEPSPETSAFRLSDTETGVGKEAQITSYPGTFSHGKLDQGSRFLLEHMQIEPQHKHILDLGCGSGVLGVVAGLKQPEAQLCFVDENRLAVESAKCSAEQSLSREQFAKARFVHTHCLDGIEDQSQDLILNNPPFHDSAARTGQIARQMFMDSKRVLRKNGQLVVIANRHLGYHIQLKKIFGHCITLTGNKKFVILVTRVC